ncbi:apoptosis-stimulating of p53 protein 2a isoform X1 [Myxocyprinus asiaticus]|uniref:apoptosis-stimulating of p53 protein 2a isoform X1 n=1 Tax=Myxocyprinus asiaticus TaxID=70543 RepID=UPI002222893A|nr:apoptosis-stimulating of p53 protein 2a isoform X1 [Myxocyprinus asiaticus]
MMPMFLTVYLSNNEQHFTEVPIIPETLCCDVVELCKEPGEISCHLAEVWRGSERVLGESEKMMDLLLQWGQERSEVRFFLRHGQAPSPPSDSRSSNQKRNDVKRPTDRRTENGVNSMWMSMTLVELQEMATRQQQQIDAQQQLLASKVQEQRLHFLKQQEHRQQQASSEQETLKHLRETVEKQEAQLKKVRALKGQVEHKRLSNGKLVEEIDQMNSLLLLKQKELVVAVSKVEELSKQLETLKNGRMDKLHNNRNSVAELDRLYRELQLRNNMNQEQNSKLQLQRENLNERNQEVAAMDKRVNELRDRLWKKKAAIQQKENLPVPVDGLTSQQTGPSRVAAVGPYIQSSTVPRGPIKQDLFIKPTYPDGTATVLHQDRSTHSGTAGLQSNKMSSKFSNWSSSTTKPGNNNGSSTLPPMANQASEDQDDPDVLKRDRRVRPASMFGSIEPPAASLRKNQSSEDLMRDAQSAVKNTIKVPPPVPSKPKQANLPSGGQIGYTKMAVSSGTFPRKSMSSTQQPPGGCRSGLGNTLPLPSKQEAPPAATVHPFSPEGHGAKDSGGQILHKPQTLATSSIYSMYTQQPTTGKTQPQGVQGALSRAQNHSNFTSVYGKPVIPTGHQSQNQHPENPYLDPLSGSETEMDHNTGGSSSENQETERIPRPLSPTKLLPFISNPYRHQSDFDLEALRKKLYNAPRPLKKRSSITEPEGPGGPNIQKLLYQKTTLAAMETAVSPPGEEEKVNTTEPQRSDETSPDLPLPEPPMSIATPETEIEDILPPPPPHPAPQPDTSLVPPPPQPTSPPPLPPPESFMEEFPPYPPPPYPSGAEQDSPEDTFCMMPPEVTGQVPLPPGKRTNLRKAGSERIDHNMRVRFNPLALLLDSSLEGEFDLVQRVIYEVEDPSEPNDEGITALHNAVCAGHTEIVKFLVQFGVNVNAADSDGWTPLHCAASCNNVQVCKFLVESGAAVFAMTYSDLQTAADKCEEMEEGYTHCSQFLYGVQEKMGIMNRGVVYGLWDFESEQGDELLFSEGDCMTILRREDEEETEWWWARTGDREGYVPRNLLGLYPRIKPRQRSLA